MGLRYSSRLSACYQDLPSIGPSRSAGRTTSGVDLLITVGCTNCSTPP